MLPTLTSLALLVSVVLGVYAFNMFVVALLAAKRALSRRDGDVDPSPPEHLPVVTVQMPIYNEGPLVERVLENISELDYPKEKLQLQILDDSTDKETVQKEKWLTQDYGEKGYDIQLVHRDNRKGFKAGALNNGLKDAKGDYVVIVDVDTLSPSGFLKETLSQFSCDEKLAFVQTRCDYTDRWFNWVTESNALTRDVHFLVEQPAKTLYDLLPNFSGKAGMWRKEVLEKYGWDETVLTEDIELSYRVQMDGWRSIYLENPTCHIELPVNMTSLKIQQRRWTAGFAQSLRKLWRPLLRNPRLTLGQKLETLLFLSSPITHLAVMAALILWVLAAIFESETALSLWLGSLGFSTFLLFLSAAPHLAVIIGIAKSGDRRVRKLLTTPLMLVMVTANLLANAKGAIMGFTMDNLTFERTHRRCTIEGGGNDEDWTTGQLRDLAKRNCMELLAAALTIFAIIAVLLKGQITSALPLSYISLVWLVTSFQK